jgi:tetratricopeptide (TPR) repeat protein
METRLDAANRLAEEGRMEEALGVLRAALGECPDHAAANFAYARLLDGLGPEREAIPHYEHSIFCGLPREELQEATVNLGSSYRAVGEPERAVEVLRGGLMQFPENRAVRVFLAMALHDLGGYSEATGIFLRELAESSSDQWVAYYGRAIAYYAKEFSGKSGSG